MKKEIKQNTKLLFELLSKKPESREWKEWEKSPCASYMRRLEFERAVDVRNQSKYDIGSEE